MAESKKTEEVPTWSDIPKPTVLQEAPPPEINPWTKRAATKLKTPVGVTQAPVSHPTPTPPKEDSHEPPRSSGHAQATRSDDASSLLSTPTNATKKPTTPASKKATDSATTKTTAPDNSNVGARVSPAPADHWSERKSSTHVTRAMPAVKDDVSWPTPNFAQGKDRKESHEKESEDKREDDAGNATKRKKQEWKPIPVVPNIILGDTEHE